MDYIYSDTNVWIDFFTINRIGLPFRLPYTYIMYSEAIDNELLSPKGLGNILLRLGLERVKITEYEEFELAENYGLLYPRLSIFDRIALAIAKKRQLVLLTGDGSLRKAAEKENVVVKGTLFILDELKKGNYIDRNEYKHCLSELQKHNGGIIRLPKDEISLRLNENT